MPTATDELSLVFSALADPTRRAILGRLAHGDATVTELAAPFDISMPAVSRHLKVLENAGLITRSRNAQWRTSALRVEPLEAATDWMEQYRVFWDAKFDRLETHLKRLQGKADPTDPRGDGAPETPAPPVDRATNPPEGQTHDRR